MSSMVVALGTGSAAQAGNTRATPPVNVVAPAPSSARYPDDLPGPQVELVREPARVALPAVPAFELPAMEDGMHGPRELRVRGRHLYGRELAVRGYVTWIYDCAAELARSNHEASAAAIAELIERTPGLCEAPMFSLGDTRQTPRDGSIWIVDIPSVDRAGQAAPRLAVGDYVTVTGTWQIESPRGERNSNGLLVYRGLERPVPPVRSPALVAAPQGLPEVAIVTEIPLRAIIDTDVRNVSVGQLNTCNHALAAKQYDAALIACHAATEAWPDNHLAWYGEAAAHLAKGAWHRARAAIAHAVELRPDQAMYQLYDGLARYEAERLDARTGGTSAPSPNVGAPPSGGTSLAVATPPNVGAPPSGGTSLAVAPSPDVGAPPISDATAPPLELARDALLRATKLAPALWRAHYYLGRVYRDLDDTRRAAEQLTQAIALHPAYRPAYLALCELYRRWGYLDQAIAVATLGAATTSDPGELWLELALALDAKHADAAAIAALGKLLAARPDDPSALLARGQLYLRTGDLASAKRDLARISSSTDPRNAIAARLAAQLLARIEHRSRAGSASTGGARGYKKTFDPAGERFDPWPNDINRFRF